MAEYVLNISVIYSEIVFWVIDYVTLTSRNLFSQSERVTSDSNALVIANARSAAVTHRLSQLH